MERFWRAETTRGSDNEEEEILSTRATSIARINRSSGRMVMSTLSEEVLGSGKQDKASAGPIAEPGRWRK